MTTEAGFHPDTFEIPGPFPESEIVPAVIGETVLIDGLFIVKPLMIRNTGTGRGIAIYVVSRGATIIREGVLRKNPHPYPSEKEFEGYRGRIQPGSNSNVYVGNDQEYKISLYESPASAIFAILIQGVNRLNVNRLQGIKDVFTLLKQP